MRITTLLCLTFVNEVIASPMSRMEDCRGVSNHALRKALLATLQLINAATWSVAEPFPHELNTQRLAYGTPASIRGGSCRISTRRDSSSIRRISSRPKVGAKVFVMGLEEVCSTKYHLFLPSIRIPWSYQSSDSPWRLSQPGSTRRGHTSILYFCRWHPNISGTFLSPAGC